MRRSHVIVLAAMFLGLAVILAWQFSHPREPMYEGRPLSYWLEGYDLGAATETSLQSADGALRQAGTNAIPTLLRLLEAHDSPLKIKLFALLEKQHVLKFRRQPAEVKNVIAMAGFKLLGGSARMAVPALAEIYRRNCFPSQIYTAACLGELGPAASNAVPALLTGLNSAEEPARYSAADTLGKIHSRPDLAVPALVHSLRDSKMSVRMISAKALGQYGPDAEPAVPVLTNWLTYSDPLIRYGAFSALRKIDPETAARCEANSPLPLRRIRPPESPVQPGNPP